jgi:hypothetical protein
MSLWELIVFALTDETGLGGGGGQMRQPASAPETPKEEDPAVQKRKAARMSQQRYSQGFASTVATDRSGLGSSAAMTPAVGTTEKLG